MRPPISPIPPLIALRPHVTQQAFLNSQNRFNVVPAGRRSGKTEIARRRIVRKALQFTKPNGWFVCAAPTHLQAKRIYWDSLKAITPKALITSISETELTITLYNGARLTVLGMDKPERIEGLTLDHIVFDEYGNSKKDAWYKHVRPALSTIGREGSADLIGVPEGRNHYWEIASEAQINRSNEWGYYHWKSAEILSPAEIASAKETMDPLTFEQEYEASFVQFEGRAYYPFTSLIHATTPLPYDPEADLIFCLDFNRNPGVAVICQEQIYNGRNPNVSGKFTAVIGEVYIPKNSNTPAVCRRLIHDWKHHTQNIFLYGDATGGAKTTSAVAGSDWDIVEQHLRPVFGPRLKNRVQDSNPRERVRINSMNARLESADGHIRLLIDPKHAPHTIRDLEGVTLKEGTAGELDKDDDPTLTHLSDALGYYITTAYPLGGGNYLRVSQII